MEQSPAALLPTTPADYLKSRVDVQINWHGQKSTRNQKSYKRLKTAQILAAALLPAITGLSLWDGLAFVQKLLIALLGATVAVTEGVVALYKYHDNWIQYRSTAETLIREKFLYQTASGAYQGRTPEDAFALLVSTVEDLLSQQTNRWQGTQAGDGSTGD